jgi:hypothetical protein
MSEAEHAGDPRWVRPAEVDALLDDLRRIHASVDACYPWRRWLEDWRGRLTDAATSTDDEPGDLVPELVDEVELRSGMAEVQQAAFVLCAALKDAFGFGGVDSAGDDHPIYPRHHEWVEVSGSRQPGRRLRLPPTADGLDRGATASAA